MTDAPDTERPAVEAGPTPFARPWLLLFALSFTALFLELMLIRWVPAVVRVVAYYSNLMLISSFMGLGLGALIADRGWRTFRWFPTLLLLDIAVLLLLRDVSLPASQQELRYFHAQAPRLLNWAMLIAIFVLNTILFLPLGERIGELFKCLPPLRAYGWDLLGSLLGTVCFAAFSLFFFSPLLGMAGVTALYLLQIEGRSRRIAGAVVFAAALGLMIRGTDRAIIWSPYYAISIHEPSGARAGPPPTDLRTMRDPPTYTVRVNQDVYQAHGTIDPRRYSTAAVSSDRQLYTLPYALRREPQRVLVLGSGGGLDVEAALIAGAEEVHAVEIDPALIRIARRYSAGGAYDDPRTRVIVDDARAYLERGDPGSFDLVVFGYLDSQALFSSMSNIRLDGFVYTVESMRAAYRLLDPERGLMVLGFAAAGQPWLMLKLVHMVRLATGAEPIVYHNYSQLVVCVSKGAPIEAPQRHGGYQRVTRPLAEAPPATDDWPYLYLVRPGIPTDYVVVIGTLVFLCALTILLLRRKRFTRRDPHFFFLGLGFLLLETKAIVDCSLFFGATWLVTTVIVAGVLLMVLAANLLVLRLPPIERVRWLYAGLFASLVVVCFTPTTAILGLALPGRVLWTLLVVPLPIFFAGVIFSTSFRHVEDPAACFGSNLLGATMGGFGEYLGMWIGSAGLGFVLIAAYAASAWALRRLRD